MDLAEAVLAGIIVAVIAYEFGAWTPRLVERLLRTAIHRLPPELQQRYEEEWRADLACIPGRIGKMLYAVSLIRGAQRMRGLASPVVFRKIQVLQRLIAAFGIVFQAPLFLLIATAIKTSSNGPVIVTRKYVYDGNTVKVFAFRIFDTSGKCMTRTGKFLYRTELYKTPVLFNILKGDIHWTHLRKRPR